MDRIRLRARTLRNNLTDTEKLLWRQLRFWQLHGYKFRRQQPIGNYIVDFVAWKNEWWWKLTVDNTVTKSMRNVTVGYVMKVLLS